MLFHRSGQVAMQAALLLALEASATPRRARELGLQLGVPPTYLVKVLHELARAGVLRSVRGPAGGFHLARPAQEICLWDVLAAVEPVGQLGACLLGLGACTGEATCPLHNDWAHVRNQLVALLQKKTLADIAAEAKQAGCFRLGAGALQPQTPALVFTRK